MRTPRPRAGRSAVGQRARQSNSKGKAPRPIASSGGDDALLWGYVKESSPKIFLDTDIDSDIDDVLDLMLLLNLERRSECNIIGICVSSTNIDAAGCLYAILNYYGRTAIPVGANSTTGNAVSVYTTATNTTYGVAGHTLFADFEDGVTATYRRELAASADNSVVILTTGSLGSIVELLQTTADGFSGLNGVDLIKQKVRAIFVTAGYWPSGAAVSDFGGSAGAITASAYFLANWPTKVPVIFNGIELGDTWSSGGDGSLNHLDALNPARAACVSYMGALTATSSRNGWSQTAILAACRGLSPYVYIADRGTGIINAGTGVTSWARTADGPHGYLRKNYTDTQLTDLVNSIISVDPVTWPTLSGLSDVDALAYFARMDGPIHTDAKQLINDFIIAVKADSDWTKLSRLHLFAVGSTADAALDMKGGVSATFSGAFTHKMYHGIHGDGVTGKIDFNFDPTSDPAGLFAQNDNHFGIYVRVSTGLSAIDFGNTQFLINPRSTGGNFSTADSHTAIANLAGVGDARRHKMVTRAAAGTYKRYRDGVADADVSQASQALGTASFYGLGQNSGGVLTSPAANRPLAAAHWGSGGISTNFYTRLLALLRGLGSSN